MRRLLLTLLLGLAACPASAPAADWAWIMSIPHARSAEFLYKVRILEIDGAPQKELIRYALPPGRREVLVELMLDLEWEPDLLAGQRAPQTKRITVEAVAGATYLVGGRIDADAPIESQLDQSYWEPVVFEPE